MSSTHCLTLTSGPTKHIHFNKLKGSLDLSTNNSNRGKMSSPVAPILSVTVT